MKWHPYLQFGYFFCLIGVVAYIVSVIAEFMQAYYGLSLLVAP